ncbi:TRAP transporter small permease [Alteribacillus sp. YIM 98480]|uniref:TRAP transporter small permease n=1 Tax=Alteribacillus sp. YIM 98480 TaxID=2606599 RepID=UPI00131CDAAD|nr:TRAP transporter small permease [Alteribacillus sp. YIM 98480]
MKWIYWIRDSINKAIEYISITMLTVMVLAITYQVFTRTVFNTTPTWSESLSVFLFLWVGFFGIAYGFRERTHISVEIFYSLFPKWLQKICRRGNAVLIIGVGAIFAYYGYNFALDSMRSNLPGLNVPTGVSYLIIPLTGIVMIIYGIINLINDEDSAGEKTIEETEEG